MKKLLIIIFGIFLSFHVSSYDFINQKEYTTKNKKIPNIPKIIEFFSFFCPYCFEFEKTHNIRSLIKKNFNENIKIQTYHVNFLGGKFSYELTKAWIIAQEIGIEEKIMIPMFKGIQETHTINNINNIRELFLKEGQISLNQYNKFWNSFTVKILFQKQIKNIEKSKIDHVPAMLINGKYTIEYARLEDYFKDNFSQKYIELIYFLFNKK